MLASTAFGGTLVVVENISATVNLCSVPLVFFKSVFRQDDSATKGCLPTFLEKHPKRIKEVEDKTANGDVGLAMSESLCRGNCQSKCQSKKRTEFFVSN